MPSLEMLVLCKYKVNVHISSLWDVLITYQESYLVLHKLSEPDVYRDSVDPIPLV